MCPGGLRVPCACWPRKTSRKLRSEPLGASESLLRSHWGLKTATRALQEASRQPQERSRRPQDSSKSALGGLKTAPRALWEASRRLQERSGRPQDAPRALRDASRRLQEHSGRLEKAQERSGRPQDGSHRHPNFLKWILFKSIFERSRGSS